MLEELLAREEGKTLEFKENASNLSKIIQTVIAFANTAGGTIVIGIAAKTKEVVGIDDILNEEMRIANAIAMSITPLVVPTIQMHTYRNKDVLLVVVPHCIGPFCMKNEKTADDGTYVRLGSTNRLADQETIQEIQNSRSRRYFDKTTNHVATSEDLDMKLASQLFAKTKKKFSQKTAVSLGLLVNYQGTLFPSNGGLLLFGKDVTRFLPNAIIRLVRFLGTTKNEVLDHQDIELPLVTAIDPILAFVRRNTVMAAKIGAKEREDIPQYPPEVVREAVTNALLHADYAISGASIQVAIFSDRIEITNPGALPLGLDLAAALAGISQLRNKVIGRVFRELNLIEQWGSGLGRMIDVCEQQNIRAPKFEEVGNFFRVTLYHRESEQKQSTKKWDEPIKEQLKKKKKLTAKEAQHIWGVTSRTTSARLKAMVKSGHIAEIGTSPFDPQKYFVLAKNRRS